MYSKFLNLNPDKQERVINAAIKEFAGKGFDNASTNEIVKEAEISKGLLFHYFKNKKNLYLYLYDYCIELCLNEYYKKIDFAEKDLFIRFRQAVLIKLELLQKYPDIFVFIEVAYLEKSKEVKNELEQINQKIITDSYNKMFENFDTTKFRDDIDINKAIKIIMWTFDGLGAEVHKKGKLISLSKVDCQKAFAEADIYIEIFKQCFYK